MTQCDTVCDTRHRFLGGCLGLAVVLGLSACAGPHPTAPDFHDGPRGPVVFQPDGVKPTPEPVPLGDGDAAPDPAMAPDGDDVPGPGDLADPPSAYPPCDGDEDAGVDGAAVDGAAGADAGVALPCQAADAGSLKR